MSQGLTLNIKQLPRILAVLIAENNEYTYADKLGYVTSPTLLIYYLREALRDYSSLLSKSSWENEYARKEAYSIDMEEAEREIDRLARISDPKTIREAASLISAKALARAVNLRFKSEKTS